MFGAITFIIEFKKTNNISAHVNSKSLNNNLETEKNIFYQNNWTKTSTDDINEKDLLYSVSLFNDKLHYTKFFDDSNEDFKLIEYNSDTQEESFLFIASKQGKRDGGVHCIPLEGRHWINDKIYYVAGKSVNDLFVFNDEIYYFSTRGFGYDNHLGKLKYDNDKQVWLDDEQFKLYSNISLRQSHEDSVCNDTLYAHYIYNDELYLISTEGIYLLSENNKLEIILTKKDWNYLNYPLIKIDDTFYTGTNGGLVSYNLNTKEQYFWKQN